MLPTFLVIGAMKAGTTSLWGYLAEHPDVFMARPKELNFFVEERNWGRGRDWYEGLFSDARDAFAVGEASPTYTMAHAFDGVPQRIAGMIPGARLIYLLRHPVERMRSHYLHRVSSGKERRPIDRALIEGLDYLHTSRYAFQLESYLEHFPREQILLVLSEDLLTDRSATLRRVFAFLGVASDFVPQSVAEELHRTADKVVRTPASSRLEGSSLARAAARYAPGSLRRWYRDRTTRSLTSAGLLSSEAERRVLDALRPDVEQLRTHLGPGFTGWEIG